MANNKQYKLKPMPFIIMGIILIVVISGIVLAVNISKDKKEKENKADVSLQQANLKDSDVEAMTKPTVEKTTIEIMFSDTAILVGTKLKITAVVTPANTEKSIIWSSSNPSVFTVDNDGIVTITGVGTAALSATIGDVSDAVAIEGISSITGGSVNGFPVYTGSGLTDNLIDNADNKNSSNNSNQSANNNSNNNGNSSTNNNSGGTNNSTNNANNSNDSNSSNSYNKSDDNNKSDISDDTNTSNNSDDNNHVADTDNNNGDNVNKPQPPTSIQINDNPTGDSVGDDLIINSGFNQEFSNVYTYTENGVYYGEIITQPNVTIIYIKQRTASFDSRIQAVIGGIMPEYVSQIWNNYISANTDRTFELDGHVVRIVVATGGGHSQIVIYN